MILFTLSAAFVVYVRMLNRSFESVGRFKCDQLVVLNLETKLSL